MTKYSSFDKSSQLIALMWYPTDKTQIANALWAGTLCKRNKGSLIYVKTNDFSANFNLKQLFQRLKAIMTQGMEGSRPRQRILFVK